jgi:hypothetical protein
MKLVRSLFVSSAFAALITGCLAATNATNATYLAIIAPKANIFKGLTAAEKTAVANFVKTSVGGNIDIAMTNILLPNKTDALAYLDGSGVQPARYARVLTSSTCYMKEYMVGPLPVGTNTKLSSLDYIYGNSTYAFPNCQKNPQTVYLLNPTEDNGQSGTPNVNDAKAAPMTILPDGPRYQYDPAEGYVSWSQFALSCHTSSATANK